MHKWKIAVTTRSFARADDTPRKMLEDAGCFIVRLSEGEDFRDLLKDADGVIAGVENYTKEIFAAAPRLKIVSRYGVGYDNIDVEAAKAVNVAVAITPGANSESVADLAFALMLSAARHIPFMDNDIKTGQARVLMGSEVWQKTLGVIGVGRIGKSLIQRAAGFQMRVLCFDEYKDEAFAEKYGARYVDFDTLLAESDFISLHAPFTPGTSRMINREAFAKMKKTAVFVNTARGGLVDEDALFRALSEGQIASCGLDVMVDETSYDNALCKLPNCIVLPHVGAATYEATHNMGMMAAKNILDFLQTGKCEYLL